MAASSDSKKSKSGGGCLGKLLLLSIFTGVMGIGVACFLIVQQQDLSDIGGYGPSAKTTPVRDLKVVLQNSLERSFAVTLTETEINQWLGHTLTTKQGGLLASQISLQRIWVRLDDGMAEVILERKCMGKPFTVSMFLMIDQIQGPKSVQTEVQLHGGPYHPSIPFPPRGGRFGKLVVPQGFLHLVLPAFEKLPPLFHDEIELGISRMSRVKIEKNRLILDPREPTPGLPQTF